MIIINGNYFKPKKNHQYSLVKKSLKIGLELMGVILVIGFVHILYKYFAILFHFY